MVTNSEFVLCI